MKFVLVNEVGRIGLFTSETVDEERNRRRARNGLCCSDFYGGRKFTALIGNSVHIHESWQV